MTLRDDLDAIYQLADTLDQRAKLSDLMPGVVTVTFTSEALKAQAAALRMCADTAVSERSRADKLQTACALLEHIVDSGSVTGLVCFALARRFGNWCLRIRGLK